MCRHIIMSLVECISFFWYKKTPGFCYDTRWIRRSYIFLGMMPPVYQKVNGPMSLKWCTMLYSFLVYAFLTSIASNYVFIPRMKNLMENLHNYDTFIFHLMFVSFMKTQYFFSVGGWLSARYILEYHNMWINFERKYLKKLKQPLVLHSLESMSNRYVLYSSLAVFSLLYGQKFLLPTYTVHDALGYIPSACGFFLYITLIHVNCEAIENASDHLLKNLRMSFSRSPLTQDVVQSYKSLWLDISNITQQFGVAYFYYSFVMLLGSMIDLTIAGYGYWTRLITRTQIGDYSIVSFDEMGLVVAVIVSACVVVHICNISHSASNKVGECFIDVLCMEATKTFHPKVLKEIDLFLSAIKNNPPDITMGGYMKLDRTFVTKLLSTIMTYLIVLIQFRLVLK